MMAGAGERRAWIGLGGNVGDVCRAFAQTLQALGGSPGLRVAAVSRVYRTPAWGFEAQPDFLNAVAEVRGTFEPIELLHRLHAIERAQGRDRGSEARWGPRTLDLDLLAVEGVVLDTAELALPHPRIAERAFVLLPWADIAPDAVIPGLGRVDALLDALDCSGIEAIP